MNTNFRGQCFQFEKGLSNFRITLVEKNIVASELPVEYSGKKVVSDVLQEIRIEERWKSIDTENETIQKSKK